VRDNHPAGRRKAQAKKGEASSTTTEPSIMSEELIKCWDNERQSVSMVPVSRVKQIYDARNPLFLNKKQKERFSAIFPLCPDHLITLIQFNVLRGLIFNREIISGVLVTPAQCADEVVHVLPSPTESGKLPPSLMPTPTQQTVLHGDWIDLFPYPELRDRLIRFPGTYDEDDMWADCIGGLFDGFPADEIERRGIIAWSPPWDITGWEFSEGFLRKYERLLRGVPGLVEATNRWRRVRGEEPFVYDD